MQEFGWPNTTIRTNEVSTLRQGRTGKISRVTPIIDRLAVSNVMVLQIGRSVVLPLNRGQLFIDDMVSIIIHEHLPAH